MYLQRFRDYYHIQDTPSAGEIELFQKTQKYTKYISWIPGLRMVAICNTISMYCSDADSDIDLFIVADEKRMWLVRILITAIFHILGVRRYGNKVAKRFCLSFFATTKGLDFNTFRLEHDIYLAYWIYYLKPILDKGNTYELLRALNANWTGEFFLADEHHSDEKRWLINNHPESTIRHPEFISGSPKSKALHCEEGGTNDVAIQKEKWTIPAFAGMTFILTLFDTLLHKLFFKKSILHKVSKTILHLAPSDTDIKTPSGIIINDDMLKFHNNDVREEMGRIFQL